MLLFSWVNFRPRQMRAARLPANCWTMTILQPALPNSFGKLFVITAALARRSILTVRQAPPCQGGCVSSARIAGTRSAFSCRGMLRRNLHDETTRYLLRRRARHESGFRIGARLARHHQLHHRFQGRFDRHQWHAAFECEPCVEGHRRQRGERQWYGELDPRVGRRGSRSKRYGSFHDQPRTEQRKIESPRVKAPPRGGALLCVHSGPASRARRRYSALLRAELLNWYTAKNWHA